MVWLHKMPDFTFHDHPSQEVGRDYVIVTIEHSKIKKCGCKLNKYAMGTIDVRDIHELKNIWQLKWPRLTYLVWNWQLTSLACEKPNVPVVT